MKAQRNSKQTWILGHINWYDPRSGKGSIIADDGDFYRLHPSTELKTDGQRLKNKSRVKFALALDTVHPIVKVVEHDRSKEKAAKRPAVTQHPKMRSL